MTDTFTLTGRILDKSKAPLARVKLVLSSTPAVLRDTVIDEVYSPPPRITTDDEGYLCIADAQGEPSDTPGVPLVVGVQYRLRAVNQGFLSPLVFTAPDAGETLDIADVISEPPAADPSWSDALGALVERVTDLEDNPGGGGGAVDSVNAQIGVVVLDAADVGARPDSYVPAWSEVTGKPSTFAPSAHQHPAADVTGLAPVATSGDYDDLTDKPAIPSIAGLATTAQVSNDIATASTADRARANHTGTQLASTISDLPAAVGAATAFSGYDVFCIAGQSNADAFGIGVDAIYLDSPDPRIKQYGLSGVHANTVVTAIDPLLSKVPSDSTRIGFGLTFAKDYLDGLTTAGRKVLLVPCAVGGTGFTSTSLLSPPVGYYTAQFGADGGSWDPGKGDGGYSLYQAAIDKTNAAIATRSGNHLAGVLWLQGEGDATLNQAQYAAKLDALIDGFRANMTGGSTSGGVPFVVGQMVPDWEFFNTAINAAHVATPSRKARTAFAAGPTGMFNPTEPYHYSAAGQRAVGHSMYTAFATI